MAYLYAVYSTPVKTKCTVHLVKDIFMKEDRYQRLQTARIYAGFSKPTDAARYFGWNENTYRSHDNGARGLTAEAAEIYAKAYGVRAEWLLYGRGTMTNGDDSLSDRLARVLGDVQSFSDGKQEAFVAMAKAWVDSIKKD